MDNDQLQTEVARLTALVDQFKQKELDDLKAQIAQLTIERDHWRREVDRNVAIGVQIHANAQEQIAVLKNEIDTLRRTSANTNTRGNISNIKR